MYKIAILCLLVGIATASSYYEPKPVKVIKVEKIEEMPEPVEVIKVEKIEEKPEEKPEPYEFSYDIVDEDGNKQGRQESGDAHGNKKGSYSMQLADGRQRWVEFVSDGEGTRMIVRTNEPGTDDQDPADVDLTVEGPIEIKEAPKPKEKKYKVIKVPVHGY